MGHTPSPQPDLSRLGLPGQQPYLPGYQQAPPPTLPSARRALPLRFPRASRLEQADPAAAQRAGAVIGGLTACLNQLDHFFRQAQALGFLEHKAKQLINRLVQMSDEMLGEYAKKWANAIAETANDQGSLLGQCAELFMQLTPRQKKASLDHMHNMALSNASEAGLAYVPAPVAARGPMPNPSGWRLVVVESPYAGDVERNLRYLRACLRDCLLHGDAPIASHGLYTQEGVLDDNNTFEREQGIDAGLAWAEVAEVTVVYTDLGLSPGMEKAIVRAENEGRQVIFRQLPGWAEQEGPRRLAAAA